METFHNFVKNRMHNNTSPEWIARGYTLFFILFMVLIFAGISVIPTLITAFTEKQFPLFFVMLGSYLGIIFLLLKKKLNYYLRSYVLCFLFIFAGSSAFITGTLTSSGRLWFLAAAAISCLLIDLKASVFFLCLSVAVIIGSAYLHDFDIFIPFLDSKDIWIMTTFTFVMVNLLVCGAIYLIIKGLRREEKKSAKLQDQLNQSQKLESIGRLTGGIAHDYNNMLLAILANTEMALDKVQDENPVYNNLIEIQKAGKKSAALTKQLLTFARKEIIKPKVIDLNEIINTILKLLKKVIGENVTVKWIPKKDINLIKMDPTQIDQIIANLSINAKDAIKKKKTGEIIVETDEVFFDKKYCKENPDCLPGSYIKLSVSDNGCGISKEDLPKIFDPFFTTKEQGEGTGLGLSTVYGIVKQNEGFITVYSEKGNGTTFQLYLPIYQGEKTKEKIKIEIDTNLLNGDENILLVEDDESILNLVKTILTEKNYQVIAVPSPKKAIEAVKNISEIDLLITDIVMPKMNGVDLSKEIIKIHPNLKVLYMSGYTENVIVNQNKIKEEINFIQKPFSINKFVQKVRECLDK